MKNSFYKKRNGITLIALVITIIVLLILAGVAISMLSGENGILKQAANSKLKTERASTDEAVNLAIMSALTAGKGDISGDKAFNALNEGLDEAGYTGGDIKQLPASIKIGNNDYTITTDGTTRETNDLEKFKVSETVVKDEKKTLTDYNGHSITIPKNFKISEESPILITQGMIIEDSEENQYVWIPVFTRDEYSWGANYSTVETKTEDTSAYYTAIKNALKTYTTTYKDSYYSDVWFGTETYGKYGYYAEEDEAQENLIYYTSGNMTETEYNDLYNNMLKSVYKNGGFYIGRYEMGIAVANSITEAQTYSRTYKNREYKGNYTNDSNEAPTIEGMTTPISKLNAVPYNFITQLQSQMLAKKLGEKTDYSNVESSIMFGVQWDAVCVFIEKFDTNNSATTKSNWLTSNDYSKLWGNYKNSEFILNRGFYTQNPGSNTTVTWEQDYTTKKSKVLYTTGAVNKNCSLNIYDFGGNLFEYTLERENNKYGQLCVPRGNYFQDNGYASHRFKNMGSTVEFVYNSSYDVSSRVSLFIK